MVNSSWLPDNLIVGMKGRVVKDTPMTRNFNLGILGHVDSGKTSIAKMLSEVKSTAAFDSCKQSQERGITIDLGFSSFSLSTESRVTLVDCPGHASLIRTIICGAQIIDAVLLVIDVTKGVQLQTAECILLAELFAPRIMVVFNKIDLLSDIEREAAIGDLQKRVEKILSKIGLEYLSFLPFSTQQNVAQYRLNFTEALSDMIRWCPERACLAEPLLIASDHCFPVKGKGSVITGTVLKGSISIGDTVEIISKGTSELRKIKSIQTFRESRHKSSAGDRVALLVSNFSPESIERGIVCIPGAVATSKRLICNVYKLSYFKSGFTSKSKIHVSVLNETLLCTAHFVHGETGESLETLPDNQFCLAVLIFEKPIFFSTGLKILASKLDLELGTRKCRFVFSGEIVEAPKVSFETFVWKERMAVPDRVVSETEILGRDLVKKGGSLARFIGSKVDLLRKQDNQSIATGTITGSFGTTGKFRISFETKVGSPDKPINLSEHTLKLRYKKNIFI